MRKNSSPDADYSHDFATFLNLSAYSLLFAQKRGGVFNSTSLLLWLPVVGPVG